MRFLDPHALNHDQRTDAVIAAIAAGGEAFFTGTTWRGLRAANRDVNDRVNSTLERLDILSCANDFASTLPFGIQRRVEIARAVIGEPSVLLFDEPAAGVSESDLEELANYAAAGFVFQRFRCRWWKGRPLKIAR